MNKEQLILILRQRLTVVSTEITRLDGMKRPSAEQFQRNHGRDCGATTGQLFLASVIADLEREGVRP